MSNRPNARSAPAANDVAIRQWLIERSNHGYWQVQPEELTETSCSITLYSTNHTHTHTNVNIRPGFSGTGPEIIGKSRVNFFQCLIFPILFRFPDNILQNEEPGSYQRLSRPGVNNSLMHGAVNSKDTGCFIMFTVITNIYNKKTRRPALMELFTATGKLKEFFFFDN